VFVGENRKRQVQAFRGLALVGGVLGGKAEQTIDAKSF
jgi:hypothetical protein